MLSPPRRTPSRKLDWVLLLLFGWSLTAFLPPAIIGTPAWLREASELGLQTGPFYSPQPWLSAQAAVNLLCGILCFYLIWNLSISDGARRSLLWILIASLACLGLGAIIASHYGLRSPFQAQGPAFSYFPNKNHSGIVMSMGAVVAFGMAVHLLRYRRKVGLLAALCFLLCFGGAIYSLSRAAIVLIFPGCLAAYLVAFELRSFRRLLKVAGPLLMLAAGALLLFGQRSLSRLGLEGEGLGAVWRDFRFDIYGDTLAMMPHLPPPGLGLGNFADVFPQFRKHSLVESTVLHPESDWLWVMAEMGVPGVALLLLAVLLLFTVFIPFGQDRSTPYRAAAFGAVIIFAIHTLIDVPAHRFGALLPALLLYRLALQVDFSRQRSWLVPPWVGRLVGIGLLLVGLSWLLAATVGLPLHTRVVENENERIWRERRDRMDPEFLAQSIDRAIQIRPLSWINYTRRADLRMRRERDAEGAGRDFAIARFLEPNRADVLFEEGSIWIDYSSRAAGRAWSQALERWSPNPEVLHQRILNRGGRPQFGRELANLTIRDPDLRFRFLLRIRGQALDEALYFEREADPELRRFTPAQRHQLLEHWARRGDCQLLLRHLRQNPGISPHAWYYEALCQIRRGQYQAAIEGVYPFLAIPAFPEFTQLSRATDAELRRDFLLNTSNLVRGSTLLKRQIDQGDMSGARETVRALSRNPQVPAYIHFWQGEFARRDGQWEAAWNFWVPYLEGLTRPPDP